MPWSATETYLGEWPEHVCSKNPTYITKRTPRYRLRTNRISEPSALVPLARSIPAVIPRATRPRGMMPSCPFGDWKPPSLEPLREPAHPSRESQQIAGGEFHLLSRQNVTPAARPPSPDGSSSAYNDRMATKRLNEPTAREVKSCVQSSQMKVGTSVR
jgi:hypothetical protein